MALKMVRNLAHETMFFLQSLIGSKSDRIVLWAINKQFSWNQYSCCLSLHHIFDTANQYNYQ